MLKKPRKVSVMKVILGGLLVPVVLIAVLVGLAVFALWFCVAICERLPRAIRLLWKARTQRATWLVIALLVVACGALILWYGHTLREWDPSIVTTAIGLALTVSAVNLLIRRDMAARAAPRRRRVLERIEELLQDTIIMIAADYLWNYLSAEGDVPDDARDIVALWQEERKPGNVANTRDVALRDVILEFHNRLEYFRWRYTDSLPLELLDAMDDINLALTSGLRAQACEETLLEMVAALGRFLAVFALYGSTNMGFTIFSTISMHEAHQAAVATRARKQPAEESGEEPDPTTYRTDRPDQAPT